MQIGLHCRIFEAEKGVVDDDVIEAQFAKWFKDYVRVLICSYYIVERYSLYTRRGEILV